MVENIFLSSKSKCGLEQCLAFDMKGRENLGDEVPVLVYRLLEFSLKEELIEMLGKEKQKLIFRRAGRKAGEYFAKHYLEMKQPISKFISQLQQRLQEQKIGVLRIEEIDEANGNIVLTLAEDADCSGLPVLGETVCHYDEGFLAGILSVYSGKNYEVAEVACWATGDRVCRFCAEVHED